jgi:hypothetical protein
MQKTDEFILNRLLWKARSYKMPGESSFFYTGLPYSIKDALDANISAASGIPVLFFTKPTMEWTLICTREVIYSDTEKIGRVPLNCIKSLRPAIFGEIGGKVFPDIKANPKGTWDKLTAADHENSKHLLHAKGGGDFFTMWNVLLMAVRISG